MKSFISNNSLTAQSHSLTLKKITKHVWARDRNKRLWPLKSLILKQQGHSKETVWMWRCSILLLYTRMLKVLKGKSVSKKKERKDRKWIRKMNWQYISFYYPSINASSLPLNASILQFCEFSMRRTTKG